MFNNSRDDLKLDDITYEWLEKTTDVSDLKQAIKLILDDGDYFSDLRKAIEGKIAQLKGAPTSAEAEKEQHQAQEEVKSWVKGHHKSNPKELAESESEKIKGNEAMSAGDFKEALAHYTRAIQLHPTNAILYGNRAMTFMKLKDFKAALNDAEKAKTIDQAYLKGYYRSAKAQEALGNLLAACYELVVLLKRAPDNAEALGELATLKKKLNAEELHNLSVFEQNAEKGENKKSVSVKIEVDEEDEDSAPRIEKSAQNLQQKQNLKPNPKFDAFEKEKDAISERIKRGDFEESAKDLEKLLNRVEVEIGLEPEGKLLKAMIHNNISLCHRQTGLDQQALEHASFVVDYFSTLERSLTAIENDLAVKALLRRGMSFERLGKFNLGYADFRLALRLQPGLQAALDGVRRTETHLLPEDITRLNLRVDKLALGKNKAQNEQKFSEVQKTKVEEPKNPAQPQHSSEKEIKEFLAYEELLKLKSAGNDLFKNQKYSEAIKIYTKALDNMKETLSELTGTERELRADLLSNKSMAQFYSRNFMQGLEDAKHAHALRPTEKTEYRIVLNGEALLTSETDRLAKVNSLSANEMHEAEKLLTLATEIKKINKALIDREPNNSKLLETDNRTKKSADLLTRIVKREQVTEVQNKSTSQASIPKETDSPKETISNKPEKFQTNLSEVTALIKQKGMRQILDSKELPSTIAAFETELSAFDGEPKLMIDYLIKVGPHSLTALYKSREMEIKNFLKILKAIEATLTDLSIEEMKSAFELLQAISKTKGIQLTCKMMLSKEKDLVRKLINKTSQAVNDDVQKENLFKSFGL